MDCRLLSQRQGFNLMACSLSGEELFWWVREREFSQRVFEHDFPTRYGAEKDVVGGIAKEVSTFRGEGLVVSHDPEKCACI